MNDASFPQKIVDYEKTAFGNAVGGLLLMGF